MSYKYSSRLSEHELRLLSPVSISHNRLDFELVTVARSFAPTYFALSYAWGTQKPTERIFLNGQPFAVRPNLWSCLFNLCGSAMGKMYLWVDAICINQGDDQEKSTQVKRMSDTYARAEHVAVWLGLPSSISMWKSRVSDVRMLKSYQVSELDWWMDMTDLAKRDYWSRYWVIQELLLSRNILIWCGNHAILSDKFQDMLCDQAGIDRFSSNSRDWKADQYPALSLIMGRHVDGYPEIRESLSVLLIRHRKSECGDMKDRVFALLGIVAQEEAVSLARFLPDYSLSKREVVIITLAHLTQASLVESVPIDVHSEAIFEALRVSDKKERRELLEDAKKIDHIGSESVQEIRAQLEYSYLPDHLSDPEVARYEAFVARIQEDLIPRRPKSSCIMS